MFTILTTIFLSLYGAFLVWLMIRIAARKSALPEQPQPSPSLSIVVPFKNEAHNLDTLCASLALQDFCGAWEVILVNDGSDDDFAAAVERAHVLLGARLVLVESRFDAAQRLTSKQQALDKGVAAARYEWVVFTDADMEFAGNWLSSYASCAEPDVSLVFGHTAIRPSDRGLFALVQRFQLEFLFATAYAFHAASLDSSCMGNNLLIRKSAYCSFGGQEGIGYSIVEDRDLYRAFTRRGFKTAPCEPFRALAFTASCTTPAQFYHQALRWARGGFSRLTILLPAALLFTFQNAAFAASLFGCMPRPVTILTVLNFFITLGFTGLAFWKTHSGENVLFLPVYLIFTLVEAIVFCCSFFVTPKVRWKSRKL
jgi:cellulose synthase/poly-beta-1,6-N-acetylglucosamine synthase-like glycosyltransferase